jgi:hypothetical protein
VTQLKILRVGVLSKVTIIAFGIVCMLAAFVPTMTVLAGGSNP